MARIRRYKEGITVAGGPRDICGGDNPASADMALDYKRLTEAFAKPLRQHSGNAIDTAASGMWNDDRRRPHRVATFTSAGQHLRGIRKSGYARANPQNCRARR